jgi:hypothetical protein
MQLRLLLARAQLRGAAASDAIPSLFEAQPAKARFAAVVLCFQLLLSGARKVRATGWQDGRNIAHPHHVSE